MIDTKMRKELSPLMTLIGLLFLLGGVIGFWGPNPRLVAIYIVVGLILTLISWRYTFRKQ